MKRLLVVDDDHSIRTVLREALADEGYSVDIALDGKSAMDLARDHHYDLVITDLVMPRMNGIELMEEIQQVQPRIGFLVISAYGSIEKAVEALQKGAFDFVTKPFSIAHLKSRMERYFEFTGLKEENIQLKRELSRDKQERRLVGRSNAIQMILNQIEVVAQSDAPVFVQGESGTGKELVAQAIHESSDRRDRPFLKINCAAIPENLFESTLFGHEKGAFTNAIKTTKGLFEEADGGTLLLDEISEMPVPMQAKLLRVLQEGIITRIGSVKEISVDVRVLATTNRNILEMVKDNSFRQDLYFRLNVFPIKVPPLRSRTEDIPVLINHFIAKLKNKYGYDHKYVEQATIDVLMRQSWPGNIRQLENLIERAILYSAGDEVLTLNHFSMETEQIQAATSGFDDNDITIHEMEKKLIYHTLKRTNNNRSQAAKILGISVRTLRNKLHEYEDSPG